MYFDPSKADLTRYYCSPNSDGLAQDEYYLSCYLPNQSSSEYVGSAPEVI
jgi:hypothetical protein